MSIAAATLRPVRTRESAPVVPVTVTEASLLSPMSPERPESMLATVSLTANEATCVVACSAGAATTEAPPDLLHRVAALETQIARQKRVFQRLMDVLGGAGEP